MLQNKQVGKTTFRNKQNFLQSNDKIDSTPITQNTNVYIQAATSENTRKAYRHDIRHFMSWGGLLPTTTDVVIQYLHDNAQHLNSRTLSRRLTALKNWHHYQGFPDPTNHPLVRKTMTGIKNVHGVPKNKAPALQLDDLITMVDYLKANGRLIDHRDSALLQIGFFGAFRRSELANIQWENIKFSKEGIEILIPRSKTDQGGEGQVCAIPYGNEVLCPVKSLMTWKEKAAIETGAVFRRINKSGVVSNYAIAPNRINIIIKSIAQDCKLPDAEKYSSHSLRRGFATTASKNAAPFGAILRQGRWRHEGTVLGYIEEGKRFDDNAVSFILNNKTSINYSG